MVGQNYSDKGEKNQQRIRKNKTALFEKCPAKQNSTIKSANTLKWNVIYVPLSLRHFPKPKPITDRCTISLAI